MSMKLSEILNETNREDAVTSRIQGYIKALKSGTLMIDVPYSEVKLPNRSYNGPQEKVSISYEFPEIHKIKIFPAIPHIEDSLKSMRLYLQHQHILGYDGELIIPTIKIKCKDIPELENNTFVRRVVIDLLQKTLKKHRIKFKVKPLDFKYINGKYSL